MTTHLAALKTYPSVGRTVPKALSQAYSFLLRPTCLIQPYDARRYRTCPTSERGFLRCSKLPPTA